MGAERYHPAQWEQALARLTEAAETTMAVYADARTLLMRIGAELRGAGITGQDMLCGLHELLIRCTETRDALEDGAATAAVIGASAPEPAALPASRRGRAGTAEPGRDRHLHVLAANG